MNAKVAKMKKYLADVYGITTYEQLEKALADIGGIPIALFVDRRKEDTDEDTRNTCCNPS